MEEGEWVAKCCRHGEGIQGPPLSAGRCVRNAGGRRRAYDIVGSFRRYPDVANEELLVRGNHSSALTNVCEAQNMHFSDRNQQKPPHQGSIPVFFPLPLLLYWREARRLPATVPVCAGPGTRPSTAYLGFPGTAARASASTRTGFAAGRWATAARRRQWLPAREGRG